MTSGAATHNERLTEELKHRLEAGSEVYIADTLSRLGQFPMTQAAVRKNTCRTCSG